MSKYSKDEITISHILTNEDLNKSVIPILHSTFENSRYNNTVLNHRYQKEKDTNSIRSHLIGQESLTQELCTNE